MKTAIRLALALAAVGVGEARAAARANEGVRLAYVRDPRAGDCPNETALRAAVARRLGYDPFRADAPTRLTATISLSGRALIASVEMTDARGQAAGARRLTSRRGECAELASAMELQISIAVEALRQPDTLVAAASAAHSNPEVKTPELVAQETPGAAPRPNQPAESLKPAVLLLERSPAKEVLELHVSVGMMESFEVAPAVAFGFTAQAGLERHRWSLGLEARGDLPASSAAVGHQLTTSLLLASLVPCFRHWMGAFCLLASAGAQLARSSGFSRPAETAAAYSALGARLALEIPASRRLKVRLHADLLAALTRAALVLDEQLAFRPKAVSISLGAALNARVW